jgi:hypothetical protein
MIPSWTPEKEKEYDKRRCKNCGKKIEMYSGLWVEPGDKYYWLCQTCLEKVTFCSSCNEPVGFEGAMYILDPEWGLVSKTLCSKCFKNLT